MDILKKKLDKLEKRMPICTIQTDIFRGKKNGFLKNYYEEMPSNLKKNSINSTKAFDWSANNHIFTKKFFLHHTKTLVELQKSDF